MPKVVAITHVPFEDLGSLGMVLAERGFAVQTVDASCADLASLDPSSADLWVVLGGPIGVYETEAYPFLTLELELLRQRLHSRLPTLGICLGAQLMAAALGARVYPGKNGKEIGWGPLSPGSDAAACPAMADLLAPPVGVLHWHGDTFDLPAGAQHLAASSRYPNQAFALGRHALGLQFHAEVQAATLERWYVGHAYELGAARIDIPQLRAAALRFAPALRDAARRCFSRWLDDAL